MDFPISQSFLGKTAVKEDARTEKEAIRTGSNSRGPKGGEDGSLVDERTAIISGLSLVIQLQMMIKNKIYML